MKDSTEQNTKATEKGVGEGGERGKGKEKKKPRNKEQGGDRKEEREREKEKKDGEEKITCFPRIPVHLDFWTDFFTSFEQD